MDTISIVFTVYAVIILAFLIFSISRAGLFKRNLSKRMKDVLFGNMPHLEGGLPVRANITYPLPNGGSKTIHWEGNMGILIYMHEKIEHLEMEVRLLKQNAEEKNHPMRMMEAGMIVPFCSKLANTGSSKKKK